jgi:hypothetical protein
LCEAVKRGLVSQIPLFPPAADVALQIEVLLPGRSTRLRKGAPWLKTTLVQTAPCATRAKKSYLRAQFLRLKARRGPRKAIVAVAASILTAAYFMLIRGDDYHDLGPTYFEREDRQKTARGPGSRCASRRRSPRPTRSHGRRPRGASALPCSANSS